MSQRLTNITNIPLSLAVWLASDNYQYSDDPKTISVTTLMKSVRQIVLGSRIIPGEALSDISGSINSSLGTAIHDSIEDAWLNNPQKALEALGYPKRVIARIQVNPCVDDITEDTIAVYLEQRTSKQIKGMTVSGKFDFIADGRVEDFKSTGTYSYTARKNDEKYRLQGSLYRWLNPTIITQDDMHINFIFTDWSQAKANQDNKYPQSRILPIKLDLMSYQETESYVSNKIDLIQLHEHSPEEVLPPCSDDDLWRKDPVWKYYKNPQSLGRSTKNFDNYLEAVTRLAEDNNVGLVKEVKGEVVACRYCNAFTICKQKDSLIASGDLIVG